MLCYKYKHPIHKELEETAKKVGGHGGMDFIMDYRLAYCLQNGLPLDMDVYDLAEWCCMACLEGFGIAVFINVIMIIYKMLKHEPMNNPALGEKPD